MAQTTILAAGTAEATSSEVVVASGGVASVGIFVASGEIPDEARFDVVMDTPGANVLLATLTREDPTTVIAGPGTFYVVRKTVGRTGVSVGAFSEA